MSSRKHDHGVHEPKQAQSDVADAASNLATAGSYTSPSTTRIGQEAMQYYNDRQLTTESILSAELGRDNGPAAGNMADTTTTTNGVRHPHHYQHEDRSGLPLTPSQQVGIEDLSYADQSTKKKRAKVSRACDECRRKKVCFILSPSPVPLRPSDLTD